MREHHKKAVAIHFSITLGNIITCKKRFCSSFRQLRDHFLWFLNWLRFAGTLGWKIAKQVVLFASRLIAAIAAAFTTFATSFLVFFNDFTSFCQQTIIDMKKFNRFCRSAEKSCRNAQNHD